MSADNQKERHLSLEDVSYFERAMDAFDDVKGTEGVNDFFESLDQTLRGKEILVSQHKTCSRFLESYIKECPVMSLQRLFRAFSGHYEEIAYDKFSSRVVEQLVTQGFNFIDYDISPPKFSELLSSLVTELTPNAAELAEDVSGSHVARAIIYTLSVHASMNQKIDKFARKIIQGFVNDPNRAKYPQYSATLQSIASLDGQYYGKLIRYLLSNVPCNFENICDKCESKLIECMIVKIGAPACTMVFDKCFRDKAYDAVFTPIANFVLQRWLENDKNNEELIVVIKKIMPKMISKRPQIIVSLSKSLTHVDESHQKRFIEFFTKESNGKNLIEYINSISPPNGSKILQNLCNFKQSVNKPFVDGVLQLGGEKIIELSLDQAGSFFVSEFLRSQIDEKSKMKVIRRLILKADELAVNRNGAFVIEAAFKVSDLKTKANICEALKNDNVKNNAKYIWRNFRMDQFISRRQLWEKDTETIMKKQDAMDDIIEDKSIPDVKPLAPKVTNPSLEIEKASQELEGTLGVLHKHKHKHSHKNC